MQTISRFKAVDIIRSTKSKGTFFSVTFVKRTNGELRRMNCRLGVRKGVTGKGLNYDPLEKGLLPVYDARKGFRMINLETVKEITVAGVSYKVESMSEVQPPPKMMV